jgi:hemerythrin-like domain-containing protein
MCMTRTMMARELLNRSKFDGGCMHNQPTAIWHSEHVRFSRLLDVLEKQVIAFHDGGEPNYRLMLEIVDYLRSYPDRFHHPREDVAFERLIAKESALKPLVSRLHQEHRVIAHAGEAFREKLDAVLNGAMIPRERVEAAAAIYLVYYRKHIETEERSIIPQAARLLDASDWEAVAGAGPVESDRLFGDDFDVRYRDLRYQIMQAGPL